MFTGLRSVRAVSLGSRLPSGGRKLVPTIRCSAFRTFSGGAKTATKAGEKENLVATEAEEIPTSFLKKKNNNKALEDLPVDFSDISRANIAIRGGVKRTPSVKSVFLSEIIGANIFLKPEFQQFTGSFKERGARNAILSLLRDKGSDLKGVIAASAGNHALALAYHGKDLGVPVTVVMPVVAPLAKVDKCRVSSFKMERCKMDILRCRLMIKFRLA